MLQATLGFYLAAQIHRTNHSNSTSTTFTSTRKGINSLDVDEKTPWETNDADSPAYESSQSAHVCHSWKDQHDVFPRVEQGTRPYLLHSQPIPRRAASQISSSFTLGLLNFRERW